jgi:uncharacterized repeat protein (TIGR01451 family)
MFNQYAHFSNHAHSKQKFLKTIRIFHELFLGLLLLLVCATYSHASAPAGYSEYYIPGDEANMRLIFNTLDAAGANYGMHAVISVTAWSANTKIYYDHWEHCQGITLGSPGCTNGYNFDPANPDATADEIVTLTNTGDQRIFESSNIPTNPRGKGTFYDGGDRIYVAGGAVTVTRASWIEAVGVGNQSAAWEIYPVKPQLTTYVMPFGENLGFADFNRVFVLIQATEDNTTFQVDLNGDGTFDNLNQNRDGDKNGTDPGDTNTVTLQRGQTFLLDRTSACLNGGVVCLSGPGNLPSGTIIQGSKTLQVKFVAGNPGQTYCARGFSAFPRGFWTKDYYAPLDQPTTAGRGNTDYYLHNPNASAITITWQGQTTSGSFNIPANSTVSFRTASGGAVPANSAIYFNGSDVFWGVGVGDAGGAAYEWGFSLLPSTMLYNEHFLGWAPGSLPLDIAGNPGNQDNDGVFLTVAQDNTRVWVDFNNDGVADLIDANGDGTPESSYVTLNRLQTQFFYDPTNAAGGGDLSQAHFWGTGPFSMVYGENGDTATTSSPSLDLGYVAIPGNDFISLVLTVDKSVSPQVVPTAAGSTSTFTLTVNSQKYTVDGIRVLDMLPANWQYLGPTSITLPNMTTVTTAPTVTAAGAALPAPFTGNCPASGGACLTWDNAILGNMAENQQITITYTARTTAVLAAGTLSQNRVTAIGTRTFGTPTPQTQTFTTTNFAYVLSGALQFTKTSGATNPVSPGNTFTYTTTVTNPLGSGVTLTGVTIYDPLPAGVTSVAGTTVCNSSVGDRFGTVAYTNNDGTQNWVGDWVETNDDNLAASGRFLITGGGELQLHNVTASTPTVTRTVNLTGASTATLTYSYRQTGADAGDDFEVVVNGTMVRRWSGAVAAGTDTIDISAYIGAATTIQFRARANTDFTAADDYFFVDNVFVTFTYASTVSGNPPELLSGQQLAAGQSIACSFNVTVDDPFPTGDTSITNTASVTSTQMPIAITASATNTVLIPSALSASSGGRIWLDADADGVEDIGEPGIPNIEVTLKDRFGTPVAITLTDGNGRYLFAGVTPGTGYYVEVTDGLSAGLSQTFPIPPGLNRTTSFNLADGQVYTLADLGYRASAGTASFGDLVWVDANADWIRNAGEIGLGGVTVKLYRDSDGDGLLDTGIDTLVGTTTSSPDGTYLFTGATATGAETYFVLATIPTGYVTTNGTTSYKFINVAAGSTLLNADFAFNSTTTTYTIKDRVWTDTNGDGVFSGENGIAGVTVELLDASLNVIATTSTAADGTFTFSGLSGGGADYTVRINDTGGVLLDYYGTTSYSLALKRAESNLVVNIDRAAAPPPSYGFRPLRSVGDAIFNDLNGNGVQDAGEPGIAGVVVSLYSDLNNNGLIAGETLLGSVTTDPSGQYLFSGLADANYIVSVPIPAGYNFIANGGVNPDTDGAAAGIQNRAAMAGGTNVLDKDFGFRAAAPRSVSGTLWNDTNSDGAIDGAEARLSDVTIDLLQWNNVVASVTSAADGGYSFSGLGSSATIGPGTVAATLNSTAVVGTGTSFTTSLVAGQPISVGGVGYTILSITDNTHLTLTANYTGATAGGLVYSAISYTVRVTDVNSVLTGYTPTFEYGVGTSGPFDGQDPVNLAGGNVGNVDFGFKKPIPTLVSISDFRAYNEKGRMKIEWSTSSEIGTAGFFIFRLDEKTGNYKQINRYILPALLGSLQGGTYSLFDNGAASKKSNTYVLVEVEGRGKRNTYGPFTVAAGNGNAMESPNSAGRSAASLILDKGASDQTGKALIENDAATDEISNYTMKARGISDRKKASIETRKAAKANSNFLRGLRSGEIIKMSVSKNGLYYIDSSKISSLLGISQEMTQERIAAGTITLGNQGRRIPYLAAEDGSGIFFYGYVLNSVYSKENTYWLYKGAGLKMDYRAGEGPAPSGYSTITKTVHAEEDMMYLTTPDMDPESDYWFWGYLYVTPSYIDLASKTFTIKAEGVANTPATATLKVNLKGFTNTDANPDHHIRVSLIRGTETTVIGEGWMEGTDSQPPVVIQFDQQLLRSGSNTIKVEAVLDPGVPYSAFYVDSFDLTYQKLPETKGNVFRFKAEGTEPLTLYGFTDPSIYVFDITHPNRPLVELATTVNDEGGSFSVSFAPVAVGARYLVTTLDAAVDAIDIWAGTPSDLWSQENSADYIIIAPDELKAAVQVLADYRQAQGYLTKVVDIEDIMDEFNYGISSPEAIKDFLTYAHYSWSKAPQYVVLAGEGTYDYKDNLGAGDNLVPTMIVATPDGLFPSDNILADADGDHVPDVAIGRLPVLTAGELQDLVSKIITYESTAGSNIMMLSDNADQGGDFPADSSDIAQLVPSGFSVENMSLADYSASDIRNKLLSGISSGTFLVNYIGHGNPFTMADEGLLRMGDIGAMENNGRFFIMTAMTCDVGQFAIPGYDLLSESLLLKKDGGAVAVWAPSGLALNFLSKRLDEGFFAYAFSADAPTLGDSLLAAFRHYKSTKGADFNLDIYNLLGDPALRLVVE